MSDELLIYDPEEVRLIREYRAHLAREQSRTAVRQEILRVAHKYSTWLVETKGRPDYDTFCKDFGYQLPEELSVSGMSGDRIYKAVEDLIILAALKVDLLA